MKLLKFVAFFLYSINAIGQEMFDYVVKRNMVGTVVYKIKLDTSKTKLDLGKELGILASSNIYLEGTCYPLSKINYINHNYSAIQDSLYGVSYKKLLEFKKSILSQGNNSDPSDFSGSICFSDSQHYFHTIDSSAQYYFGGPQYVKDDDETQQYKYQGIKVFYISFEVNCDLLYVWPGLNQFSYMKKWALPESYNCFSSKNTPVVMLIKKYQCRELTKYDYEKFGFIPVEKFGYYYSEGD